MVKERQDITASNCLKGVSGKSDCRRKGDQRFMEGLHGKADE